MDFDYIKDEISKKSLIKCLNILDDTDLKLLRNYDIDYIDIDDEHIKPIFKKLLKVCEDREVFWCLAMILKISKLGLDEFKTWWCKKLIYKT